MDDLSAPPSAAKSTAPAPDRVALEDGWALWSTVEVRAAGFSARALDAFRSEEAQRCAQRFVDAQAQRQDGIDALRRTVLQLREETDHEQVRKGLRRALQKLTKDKTPRANASSDTQARAADEEALRVRSYSAARACSASLKATSAACTRVKPAA